MGLPFPTSKTATCLAPGGRLSAQRLDQPDEITDQRPRHRATGRDCGLWAAVFVANASLSRFGERPLTEIFATRGVLHPRRRQRDSRRADLARLCPTLASLRPRPPPRRVVRQKRVRDGVCLRLDHQRWVRSLFPWGQFRRRQSAVKLHTRLDVRGSLPTRVDVTGGKVHDVNLRDELRLGGGGFYLLDRG